MIYEQNELKIRARRGDISFEPDTIKLYAYLRRQGKRWRTESVLKFIEITKEERNNILQPFLEVEMHEAQKLMDDLWDCGLRPSEGTGSAGAMAATQEHLQDMKTIAFHALKIQKKES